MISIEENEVADASIMANDDGELFAFGYRMYIRQTDERFVAWKVPTTTTEAERAAIVAVMWELLATCHSTLPVRRLLAPVDYFEVPGDVLAVRLAA